MPDDGALHGAPPQKNATPKQTIVVSRRAVVVFGMLMGVLAVVLNVAGVSLGWVYLVMCAPTSDGAWQMPHFTPPMQSPLKFTCMPV